MRCGVLIRHIKVYFKSRIVMRGWAVVRPGGAVTWIVSRENQVHCRLLGARGDQGGMHAAMHPPTSETPMDPNEAVYLAFYVRLCFYVIRAFLPSLPGGRRHADHGIKSPPDKS